MNPVNDFGHVDPARTAIWIGGQEISYGRFTADIHDLSVWLSRQRVTAGERTGIFVRHTYWAWVSHLAAQRLGLTYATLSARYREETVAGQFDLVLGEFADVQVSGFFRRKIDFSPRSLAVFSAQVEQVAPDPWEVAPLVAVEPCRIVFTSGTTGVPKTVMLDSGMLQSRISLIGSSQGLTAETRLLSLLGMNTMPGFGFILATWQAGGCVLFAPALAAGGQEQLCPYIRSNLMLASPSSLQLFLSNAPKLLEGRTERKIIVAGGRLPVLVRDEALARVCCQVMIDYGASETNCIATGDGALIDRHPGAVGYVVDGAVCQIVDQEDRPVPPNQGGIVRTRTSHMSRGYGVTTAPCQDVTFRNGWFYSGDEGILFEDGLLAITGRVTETCNIAGLKISFPDFEAELAQLPEIQDACAVVLKLDSGDILVILIVCDQAVTMRSLSQKIAPRLPVNVNYNLLRVAAIPRNDMGKIPRSKITENLTRQFAQRAETQDRPA